MEQESQKTSVQRHKTEHKPLCVPGILSWARTGQQKGSWNSHLEVPQSWADKSKPIPSVPKFASWELQVPTGSCTRSQGSEIQEKDLHNWAQLFSMGQICLEVEGKTEGILRQFFPLKVTKLLPIYQIPGEKFCWKAWKQPKGMAWCMCRHVPSNRNTSFHGTLFNPIPPSSQEHPAHGKE